MKFYMVVLLAVILGLPACQKDREPEAPLMKLIDLKNQLVEPGQRARLDLDSNQMLDFEVSHFEYFSVIEQAMKQTFYIRSFETTYALTDWDSYLPVLNTADPIRIKDTEEWQWANVSDVLFALKTTFMSDGSVVWVGDWINKTRKYIPIKIINPQGQVFAGWIEASFDITTEIITLHRAALSQEPGRDVRAGG